MLTSLSISNYALIDKLHMQPSPKLSMITGETGAGKSIMLGAVSLLLGNRADTKVLLHEEQKCIVEGVFDVSNYGLKEFFEQQELDYDGACIIRREISPAGKSRSFVNDTPVLLDVLKTLGTKLMDVHSQHDTLQLADGNYQLGLIDAYSASKEELAKYKQDFSAFSKAKKEYSRIRQEAIELQKEADFNQFQLDELSQLTLQAGEQAELESTQEVLENAEDIKLKISEILELFQNEQFGISSALTKALHGMQSLERLAHLFEELKDRLQSTVIELKDIEESLARKDDIVEVDLEKLEEIRERLSKIYQLQKKHGLQTVEELMELEQQLAEKVVKFQNLDESLEQSKQVLDKAEKTMLESGEELRQKRVSCFKSFQQSLEQFLQGLGMENSKILVEHQASTPSITGLDEIELLFSANKGAAPQALKKVASGGEFSRLIFAIKYMMADKMALPTLIFDEIDSGISGEVALKMVAMMKEISINHQVICITHLPQVAGKGDFHYFVYKDNSSEKTVSKIKLLEGEERIEELAKMISGASPTASARESAKELLSR